ncbi:DUF4906 domain-containing protein [Bacteroides graminisolvens]|uniref:DUF4906 domain-containing protein n=1 Tax=Bacteroides graminisolvens TaxID=477666 RepID=UPI0029C7636D|nr:DUF4906 domain-containing protein [Bacteroides graminisolvens]
MVRYFLSFCVGLVLLFLSGCSEDITVSGIETEIQEGELAVVRLDVRANTPDNISTRALDENTIHDLHILVYNSLGELTGKSYKTSAPYTVTARSGTNCTIYAIANTGNSTLFDGAVASTEQKLKDLTTNITLWSDIIGSDYLLMAGSKESVTIDAGESTLANGMTVSRLAAKVNLAVGVAAGSGITITNYKICSLPVNSYYINRPLTTEKDSIDITGETSVEPNNINTTAHWTNSGLIDAGGASSVNTTFYMFENRRGVNSSIAAQNQKIKANAPDSATYVVINGGVRGYKATWKVYLGANNTTNFNMKRNCSYTYNITLKRNDVDSRVSVELTTPAIVGGNSNCYMIAPGGSVSIPVERANESPIAIDGSVLYNGTYYQLLTEDSWTASILWQSVAGLVTVSNATGTGPTGSFTVTANTPASNNGGNAVVQIKNSANEVLWSWHIWVTSYDPNNGGTTYSRSNGAKTYVFMDRNLGATAAATSTTTDQASEVSGLLYQWGRKDPFPGASSWSISNDTDPTIVYNALGTSMNVLTNVQTVSASANFTNSVRNPFVFYKNASSPYDWYTNGGSQNNDLWGGGTISVIAFTSKTAFDPCPTGWRVPPWTGSKSPWDGYSANLFSNYSMLFTGIGYYSASGLRVYSTGAFYNVGSYGYFWSASPYSAYGYYLYFDSGGFVYPAYNFSRANGFGIRCVKDD